MRSLHQLFKIVLSEANTIAHITLTDEHYQEMLDDNTWTEKEIHQFLKRQHITYGLIQENIQKLITLGSENSFPMLIAKGIPKCDGDDGKITYHYDGSTEVDRSNGWDFRDVMRIPTVQTGQLLAELVPPTNGTHGRTVQNKEMKAKPGKPYRLKTGENVVFDEENNCFYAKKEGQIRIGSSSIHVHHVYEVNDDISLKTGNIDFLGTVVVHGDVPSGFKIKATGDIKIFGLVEAASLEAEGSIYISEGLVGLKKGSIYAKENIYIGNVNQGHLKAGNAIYVDQSILHSDCEAQTEIICEKGNIIGGNIRAGEKVEAKEFGNRLHTYTTITFGLDQINYDVIKKLEKQKTQLQESVQKMQTLRVKLVKSEKRDTQTLLTLKKVENSYQSAKTQLHSVSESIEQSNAKLGELHHAILCVKKQMYPNTIVAFGKYRQIIDKDYSSVILKIEQNDIAVLPL